MKDVHRLDRLEVRLMGISYSCVTVHNGAESSLVVEVKEKQESYPILLDLRVQSIVRDWRFSPKSEMVYFSTRVYFVF